MRRRTSFVVLYTSWFQPPLGGALVNEMGKEPADAPAERSTIIHIFESSPTDTVAVRLVYIFGRSTPPYDGSHTMRRSPGITP